MKQTLVGILLFLAGGAAFAALFLFVALPAQMRGIVLGSTLGSTTTAGLQSTMPVILGGQQSGISVSGDGLVKGKPDVAHIQVVVEVTGRNTVETQQDAASRMDKVIAKLKELGVSADDIKTAQYSIYPEYRYNTGDSKPILIGYRVVNAVTVTIRQLDKVGAILDSVTVAGATRIDGLSYSIADPTSLQSQARALAMKQARAKAEELAKAAAVTLGKVTAINENSSSALPEYREANVSRSADMGAVQTPISPGELEIRIDVQVSYGIQ